MHVAVHGTGIVGRTLGTKLVALGHRVTMGSRRAGNESAVAWAASAGDAADEGSFADAAAPASLVVNATAGSGRACSVGRTPCSSAATTPMPRTTSDGCSSRSVAAGRPARSGRHHRGAGLEMYLPLWLRLWQATGTGHLNIKVVREP